MQDDREREELRQTIIDSLPEGFKKYLYDNLVHFHLERMVSTGSLNLGEFLVHLLDNRQQIMDSYKELIEKGHPPVYIVGSQEMIDKLKAENGKESK